MAEHNSEAELAKDAAEATESAVFLVKTMVSEAEFVK